MARIVTFGELMLRLTPPDKETFLQSPLFRATFGGAEANVAVSLANFGENVAFVSIFSENEIGDVAESQLISSKVDTAFIKRKDERMGTYFVQLGSNMRPSKVIYDRARSAIAYCDPSDFNWETILNNTEYFFFSGITPAISESLFNTLKDALEMCAKLGVTVVCDLNYRTQLWRWGKAASEIMPELVSYADILIGNEEDIQKSLGISIENDDNDFTKINKDFYKALLPKVFKTFPNLTHIAVSLRESINADHNRWSGVLATHDKFYQSRTYDINSIVDRLGGGDAFSAGIIYGLRNLNDIQKTLDFAVAASALKHTYFGDFNRINLDGVYSLLGGNVSGRILR